MKRFLQTILFLTVVFIGYRFLVDKVVFQNYNTRAIRNYSVKKLIDKKIKPGSDPVIILGDSPLMGINTAFFPKPTYNLSLMGADPRLSLSLYKQIKQNNQAPLRCLITGFSYSAKMRYDENIFFDAHVAHDFYDFFDAIKIYSESKANHTFPANRIPVWKYYYKIIKARSKIGGFEFEELQSALFPFGNQKNYLRLKQALSKGYGNISTARGRQPKKEFIFNEKYFIHGFESDETYNFYLNEIFSITEKDNTKLIFVIPPIYSKDNSIAITGYFDALQKYIEEFRKSYPNLIVLRPKIPNQMEFYTNINHLNIFGSRVFTKKLLQLLPQDCK